jgi:hypothetical protein
MYRLLTGALALLVAAPALFGLDTPAEEFKAIEKEYQEARTAYIQALRAAKTPEEQKKVFEEKSVKPDKYAERCLQLVEKNPKDPVAIDALLWVINNANAVLLPLNGKRETPPPDKTPRQRALEILTRDYITSDKLVPLAERLGSGSDADGLKILQQLMEKNPHHDVQGVTLMSLGLRLKNEAMRARRMKQDEKQCAQMEKDAEQFFERVAKDFADVKHSRRGTLGKLVEPELFELRHLSIGKSAPDIEADDLDGKAFKLSDYRGKVVMLDFWGHW